MKIAFHAPMKSPDDPRVSGDRTVARSLLHAMRLAGHRVDIASRLRSYDRGDPSRQLRLGLLGGKLARRIVRRQRALPPCDRYDLWFTYHLYHKAPDLLGPLVCRDLQIPYIVAEASIADKQAGGRFDCGYKASVRALKAADLVVDLNPADTLGVERHRREQTGRLSLPPFLDTQAYVAASRLRAERRLELSALHGLDPQKVWLLAAAMMRHDQKLASYRLLAEALVSIQHEAFHLLVVGDGPARAEVEAAFAPLCDKVTFIGAFDHAAMPGVHAAADLYVWPAIKEAWGMGLLEAQASGVPVVAGMSAGVANVVAPGVTGLLPPVGDVEAFASAIATFLDDPASRRTFSAAAQSRAVARHGLDAASRTLDRALALTCERFHQRPSLRGYASRFTALDPSSAGDA